jgi:hypothetical protein
VGTHWGGLPAGLATLAVLLLLVVVRHEEVVLSVVLLGVGCSRAVLQQGQHTCLCVGKAWHGAMHCQVLLLVLMGDRQDWVSAADVDAGSN